MRLWTERCYKKRFKSKSGNQWSNLRLQDPLLNMLKVPLKSKKLKGMRG